MAAGHRYIDSARTTKKTQLPLLRVLSLLEKQLVPRAVPYQRVVVLSLLYTAVTWQRPYVPKYRSQKNKSI
jgi:hypothetical protein